MYKNLIRLELNNALCLLKKFIKNNNNINAIYDAAMLLAYTFKKKRKVISCGNGGSHCDAMHFAEELTGKYRNVRKGYPAIAISDSSYISCISNDFSYDIVFSRYIETIGCKKDVLLAISTSGESKNIINAIKSAKKKEMKVITLTGKNAGNIKNMSDIEIIVPYFGFSDRIQEIHIKIIHILIYIIEQEMSI